MVDVDHSENDSSFESDDESLSDEDDSLGSSNHDSGEDQSNHNSENVEMYDIAREDSRKLRTWRVVILIVLMISLAATTIAAVIFLQSEAYKNDDVVYKMVTKYTKEIVNQKSEAYLKTMINLAETITTASSEEFPFVRVPKFELLGRHTRSVLSNDVTIWAPFVTESQREKWSTFSASEISWYNESKTSFQDDTSIPMDRYIEGGEFRDTIWEGPDLNDTSYIASAAPGPFAPLWQISPPTLSVTSINYNLLHEEYIRELLPAFIRSNDCVMSSAKFNAEGLSTAIVNSQELTHVDCPHSTHLTPVSDRLNENSTIMGFILSTIRWDEFFSEIFSNDVNGVVLILKNNCGQVLTFTVTNGEVIFVAMGDSHDPAFDESEVNIPINSFLHNATSSISGHCLYTASLYRTKMFSAEVDQTGTNKNVPLLCTIFVLSSFFLMALTFAMYDRFVNRRNDKIVLAAARSNAIISSLFPTQVRDRLFAAKDDKDNLRDYQTPKKKLKTMITSGEFDADAVADEDEDDADFMYKTKPIADLFPETTIIFADIVGFTAWSSVREPTQVFILLETLYRAFDEIAKRRRVFKVETIGDCYVAVTGLPDPRKDHAIAMSRFARECMLRMQVLVRKLEVTLGPDTGDLSMRMGMHSGPVTAGVLRGERSRFQLFGDTMNTAARMEHTGMRDRIQVSQETADLLIAAGKTTWVTRREDVVVAKGKGEMQTYWLEVAPKDSQSISDRKSNSSASSGGTDDRKTLDEVAHVKPVQDAKTTRLVDWNVDVLLRLIKLIVSRRKSCSLPPDQKSAPQEARYKTFERSSCPLDEVKEIITLPGFIEAKQLADPEEVILPKVVGAELHDYVSHVAAIYNKNPFHSFEHASHVTMSVVKLLSRIVAPQQIDDESESYRDEKAIQSTLHDHTYGITSDPLTQFSCVLSALIHDIDHRGVPNAQLVKEQHTIAAKYASKSPAEQNSVDLAWNLLMEDRYAALRSAIYQTDAELIRFRQLVVNSVMATDIADKELKVLRNLRWDRAFSTRTVDLEKRDTINRKATIVIEHLIQASDVAHTMQHWHIYRKWNERFFMECYLAYMEGRAENNPADGWYDGEIGFFDYYIVPLAKKLKDCGVFGVSSDEYLTYAMRNRQEWESRGREIVAEMVEMCESTKVNE